MGILRKMAEEGGKIELRGIKTRSGPRRQRRNAVATLKSAGSPGAAVQAVSA
jgi:hypothetical protein